ncbi:helix-turn-helix transcriptional regulator [Oceanirhabdus seepicola]|uniref:YafY family transcriptional regulator n=1 Tax=Oceanirhabdus seepicola TaxID=2828781 RepID=A0A9J6NZC0_9CLOT|nr:YafY family protein [Oceanirhabdus seepicola]MCM1989778.1 YafY family transcriptional regulator [Oceanirhabdus seepicola]
MKKHRHISIIIKLLTHEKVTAKELAEQLEVSTRTILRDIDTINEAGIPIISYQGRDGGFGIMSSFKIDKNFLSRQEVSTLLMSLRGIEKAYISQELRSIMDKLEHIQDTIQNSEDSKNNVLFDFSSWGKSGYTEKKVKCIRDAINYKNVIRFMYFNANGTYTERDIDPIHLLFKSTSWYVYGFCRVRNDYRLFKLSRIKNLEITDELFERKNMESYEFDQDYSYGHNERKNDKILLKFKKEAVNKLCDYIDVEAMEFKEDGYVYAELNFPIDEWSIGFILGFGEEVEVIDPVFLKNIIIDKVEKINKLYKSANDE